MIEKNRILWYNVSVNPLGGVVMKNIICVSPHLKTENDTRNIMLDVIIALAPATVFGIIIFGFSALVTVAVTVAAAVAAEALFCILLKKPLSTADLSAVVTGLLLALNLPSTVPVYIAAIGSVFAIVVVKLLFGGLGKNIVNPAIAARVFLLASFSGAMGSYAAPFSADLTATATPLSSDEFLFKEVFFGVCPGSIGETSVIMLLFGGAYLVARRVITLHIPLSFILTVFFIALFAGENPFLEISMGGVMLGAIFMATDYVTSPMTGLGKVVFGIGCGLITMIIRLFAALPEGVSYSILVMNLLVPLIDKLALTIPFGSKLSVKGGEIRCLVYSKTKTLTAKLLSKLSR